MDLRRGGGPPDYPETLGVGCICAEHMEDDHINPRLREQRLRSRARRGRTWAPRPWRTSARGNFYLRTEGFILTVFRVSDRNGRQSWRVRVTNGLTAASQAGRRRYPSADEAKRAAPTYLRRAAALPLALEAPIGAAWSKPRRQT
jgi:hypothetical protein